MKSKCIVSYANDTYQQYINISSKTFQLYANKFDYDLHILSESNMSSIVANTGMTDAINRPQAWNKIPIIKNFLSLYHHVLWLDSDIIILNLCNDIYSLFKSCTTKNHAVTIHNIAKPGPHFGARVPNTGVWILKPEASSLLDAIWSNTKYIHDGCWEQTAMLDTIGWNIFECSQSINNSFVDLPYAFNIHEHDIRFSTLDQQHRNFYHATATDNRLQTMVNQYNLSINSDTNNNSLYSINFHYIKSITDIIDNMNESTKYFTYGDIPYDIPLKTNSTLNYKHTNKFDYIFIFPSIHNPDLSILNWCINHIENKGYICIYGYDYNLIYGCMGYDSKVLSQVNTFCHKYQQQILGLTNDINKTCIIQYHDTR